MGIYAAPIGFDELLSAISLFSSIEFIEFVKEIIENLSSSSEFD